MANLFNRFRFWQQWLFWSSLGFAFFGLGLAFFGERFLPRHAQMLAAAFWNRPEIPANAVPFVRFSYGAVGAALVCCYLLLAFIAKYPFAEKKTWARNAILIAFSSWFIIDSAWCIYSGAYWQFYALNLASAFIKLLPLIFTWREFGP